MVCVCVCVCVCVRACVCVCAQAISLASLAVYLDIDGPMAALPRGVSSWTAMSAEQWDAMFLPLHHSPQAAGQMAVGPGVQLGMGGAGGGTAGLAGLLPVGASLLHQHDFLIRPVSGSLRYTRRCE